MRVLVVNAGSSSLKLSLLDASDHTLAARELPALSVERWSELRALLRDELAGADVVGHRVVHGGERFSTPVLIDAKVRAELDHLAALAPLHQPLALAALDAVSDALPSVPAVACFDTAFHASLPEAARTYALPATWRDRWPIRRYGFHGLSHAWVARRAPDLVGGDRSELRIVSCHLGAGASLCAIRGGESLDTTMGFTPLEGLVMATRSGNVDPGLLLWLLRRNELSVAAAEQTLEQESGLKGLAGTPDMREVLKRSPAGDQQARLALDVYLHRLGGGIAAMAASLEGVDVLAFTGGVGERSSEIRADATAPLRFLGISLDEQRNAGARDDQDITADDAAVRALVIRAREDLQIALGARAAVSGDSN